MGQTARAMLDARRLLYVGLMCHQAVEKVLWKKKKSVLA